ncbi:hypothetical protein [Archangium violaceum]|uniref:Lipoprotein n=1 Tax=Archangium violaceum Cb vi76 TaxID=1406225 RepID=A0A084SWY9_9BACT|nr:hypothetical protein [Archangium violaceum]KFA92974.1 hypothetical protein Q664_11835 [Archangium violaceum Cb vi76]
MRIWRFVAVVAGVLAAGCAHSTDSTADASSSRYLERLEADARAGCSSVGARINALIARGQFAEAEVLIAEATAGGLISQPQAAEKLQKIAQLSTKVGQLSASLQRAKDFPSQLKDHTLFEVKQMLENKNFSLATEAQLKMVKKLLEDPERVMEKMGTVR